MRLTNYWKTFGPRGLWFALQATLLQSPRVVSVRPPGGGHPLAMRLKTSDTLTYQHVFRMREYDFEPVAAPRTILDAGANIGLTSIFFARRFPEALILAIEPEASNFGLLERNVAPYPRIVPIQAAVWHEDALIRLVDPGLGKWGFQTHGAVGDTAAPVCHEVQGLTIASLLDRHRIDRLDLMKMDIEGAEMEVFADPSAWIDRVGTLIIELHERLRPGCSRRFYNATNGFAAEWLQGESIFLSRTKP